MQPSANQVIASITADANRFLASGNIGMADALYRGLLQQGAATADVWSGLALIARIIKEEQTAARFATLALQVQPNHPQSKNTLAACKGAAPSLDQKSTPDNRYLLIRAWNAGFWSDVDHVLGCLMLASLTNRTPIIHWGPDSRYGGSEIINAWNHFFEPVAALSAHDIASPDLACYPPKWNHTNIAGPSINRFNGKHSRTSCLSLINRPEPIVVADFFTSLAGILLYLRPGHPHFGQHPAAVYRALLSTIVRPQAAHRAAAADFAIQHFTRRPILAVHVRGTDKVEEDPTANDFNHRLAAMADDALSSGRVQSVFLLTDTAAAQAGWKKHFKDALVCPPSQVIDGTLGLHFATGLDPIALGREVLIDSLIASHADQFAGLASSNVARMIGFLKDWPPGALSLIGQDVLNLPNMSIFDPRNSFPGRD
jgi:hypothetical protein